MQKQISEYIRRIDAAIRELESTRAKEGEQIVQNAAALMVRRVIEFGTNAEGNKFTSYSQALVPYWMLGSSQIGKADFDVKKKQAELLKKKGYFATYPDWREINNRRTDIKNFSFTQTMLRSVKVFTLSSGSGVVVFGIGSSDPEYADTIIPAHSKREGVFILGLNASERAMIFRMHEARILRILRRHNILQ